MTLRISGLSSRQGLVLALFGSLLTFSSMLGHGADSESTSISPRSCEELTASCVEKRLADVQEQIRGSDPNRARPILQELFNEVSAASVDQVPAHLRARLELTFSALDFFDEDFDTMNVRADRALELTAGDTGLDRADALGTKALYFSNVGRPADSLEWLERELAERRLLPESTSKIASTLVNLGITYAETGRYSLAEQRMEEALGFALEYEAESVMPDLIRNNLGFLYGNRHEYARAAQVYGQVAERYRISRAGTPALANVLANLGQMWLSLERIDDAHGVLDEALALQRATQPNSLGMARILVALGRIHAKRGDIEQAWQLSGQAVGLVDEIAPDSIFSVIVRRAQARIAYLYEGATDAQRGLAQRGLLEAEVLAAALLPLSAERVQVLYLLGKAAQASGDTSLAIQRYEEAISVLDAQYVLVGDDLLAEAEFADAYEDLYKSLALLHARAERALSAVRVLESYRQRAAIAPLQLDETLASDYQARAEIRSQVAEFLQQQSAADANGRLASVARIERELDRLLKLDQALIAEAIADDPSLTPLLAPIAEMDSISRALRSDQRLIYFALAQPASVALVFEKSAPPSVVWLASREELVTSVDSLRAFVADSSSDIKQLQHVSSKAYDLLIAPLTEALTDADELLIVPDGELYLTPFAALYDAQQQRYLASRVQLKQLASLSHFSVVEKPRALEFAGFAYASSEGVPGLRDQVLAALPFAEQEVQAAAARFSGASELFLGNRATPTAMISATADIVHVASHAVLDPSDPSASFMALAPTPEAASGRLTIADIAAARQLSASLVVLSACDTALGPIFGGEGIISLARAFASAGVESSIASLWAVADRSSAQLMSRFYLYLSRGESRSRALVLAQRDLLAIDESWFEMVTRLTGVAPDYRHPYYWSAFVLTDSGFLVR